MATNSNYGKKPAGNYSRPATPPNAPAQQTQSAGAAGDTAGGAKQPQYDVILCDSNGDLVKAFNDKVGRETSKKIGAVWFTGGNSMFLKLDDGTTAKVIKRTPREEGQAPAAPAGRSRFS